jgi:hypothetical protein
MVLDPKKLFRALGSDDDERKARIKQILDGVQSISAPETVAPATTPIATNVQPRPLETVAPQAANNNPYTPNPTSAIAPAPVAPAPAATGLFRGLAPAAPAIGNPNAVEPVGPPVPNYPVDPKQWQANPMGTEMAAANAAHAYTPAVEQGILDRVNTPLTSATGPGPGSGLNLPPDPVSDPFHPMPSLPDYRNAPPGQDAYDDRRRLNDPQNSGDTSAAIQAYESGSRDKELHHHSLAGRLFRGLGRGWKNWDQKDGLFGLFNMIGEGVESAASNQHDIEAQRRGKEAPLFRRLGLQQQQEEFDAKRGTQYAQTDNLNNQIQNRNAQTMLDISKEQYSRMDKASQRALDKYKAVTRYHRGDDPALDEELSRGGTFPDKEPDDQLQFQIGPDGRPIVFNKKTGEYKVGSDNFSKGPTITDKDLPDELFGLPSDKEISDRAQASVGKLPEGRRVRPDVAAKLPEKYRNSDGSLNEALYWKDKSNGEVDVSPSDLYENLPSDYEQRLAGARNSLRDSQKDLRMEVAKFRTAVSNNRPAADAASVPLTRLVEDYKKLLTIKDPKDRQKQLERYYTEVLPHVRIG